MKTGGRMYRNVIHFWSEFELRDRSANFVSLLLTWSDAPFGFDNQSQHHISYNPVDGLIVV